ncbi:diguanylate cyclase domain-containing protein [Kineococcus radiotolerans]|uniref:Diguanylate cyclase/phosphodiesterase with PAS/PAC and GAF sensor(S) n=1 Tax=Kineococcus radiotolerans (strain ATCC BAA-149 / DSM 14245 / SRS30216) TaxID=266940 RepID=A6WG47_KINRD|nr:diguanylate cyclase [Kineococcus radiotolerans]ABS05786.1 diguanylate cyclase/phosphodiesterase with PAS/PAC and GAF sensor(s) [Kineococcus radiotolerans SRS30216 = ATCC BAA-149]
MSSIDRVIADGSVHSVFQPIIDLDSGAVVAYEALARGPQGPLATPDALFGAAREAGLLAELDQACRAAAFRGAVEHGLLAPLTVFVNVEPEVLDTAPVDDLLALAAGAPGELRIVLEITERALATRPAELLRTVDRVRALGWGVALDDVGADAASLAFMPLLRPDVVKLDLSLVQKRPSPVIAEIMNAVNDYAERTGARVLAEGIETPQHLTIARALGAHLGQGWLFARPAAGPAERFPVASLTLPDPVAAGAVDQPSPFDCLPAGTQLRRSPKRLLVELSKQLERQAMRLGETCVVASTFQEARHFTPATAQRYRDLVARTGFVCALGEDLPLEPVPGVRGAALAADDPIRGEWDVVVVSPHFSAALLARDLGDDGPDMERTFEYALTYRRQTVVAAAHSLLSRVAPAVGPVPAAAPAAAPASPPPGARPAAVVAPAAGEPLLQRALAASTSGITIADMRRPDQPLVYVNRAFEELAGYRSEELLGRNCRFLQGADTDHDAIGRLRSAIAEGREVRETLLNYRGPDRSEWWNEIYMAPVTDEDGRLVQYIGVQNDVTAQVEAERALIRERDRAQSYLARIEELAYTDSLTGLVNRRRFEERVEVELWEARGGDSALAVLFMDLDGFKAVNDELGHAAGDQLLVQVAARLKARLRRSDLAARLGGDEFLVSLQGLDRASARREADRVAEQLRAAIAEPYDIAGQPVRVTVSIGVATFPEDDAEDFRSLLHRADVRMYAAKHGR